MTTDRHLDSRESPLTVDLGVAGWRVPLHSHIACLCESEQALAEALVFVAAGLRGSDHCLIAGDAADNQRLLGILARQGVDVAAFQAAGRLRVVGRGASAPAMLGEVTAGLAAATAAGARVLRLIGIVGWDRGRQAPDAELLAFEGLLSDVAKKWPCVISELRPGVLDELGLEAAVEWYVGDFEKRTGISCHLVSSMRGVEQILGAAIAGATFGEAASGEEAMRLADTADWDVVILDISLPGKSGLDALGPGAGQGPPARETVLLVEDDDGIRLLARLALAAHGYRVLAAASGDLAIEVARHHLGAIHLVITDVQMPGIRGPDLAARIAGLRPGIKVLFMSGYLDRATAGEENLPADPALLEKPFSIEALAGRVREVLDS